MIFEPNFINKSKKSNRTYISTQKRLCIKKGFSSVLYLIVLTNLSEKRRKKKKIKIKLWYKNLLTERTF